MSRALMCVLVLLSAELGAVRESAAGGEDLLGKRVRIDTGSAMPLVGVVPDASADALLIQTTKRGDAMISTPVAEVKAKP